MKHIDFKHIILAAILAIACMPATLAQVNINAPTGLKKGTQVEPEKKTEPQPATSESKSETTTSEGGETTTSADNGTNRPAVSSSPRPAQQWQQPANNTAVNAPRTDKKPWVDTKKPESLNRDFSTGKNSSNLQSRQEVEMRSYGYRILVYHTNKSKNAKTNAQKRAKDISVKFPQYQFYFNYKAPTWRLRLGDFADEEAAHRALKQLRQAFPLYAKEMTIIHDHINVWK
ncbi:MAG: SPOR domain-containing protein [Muribaculaceae bacterium]|nr:SPOR domain-containing protein [Muribaculaceae bacterium]